MAASLLTHNLILPGQYYYSLIGELNRLGAVLMQKLFWLLAVNWLASELRDAAWTYIDQSDRLFVLEITTNAG
jgi:hypothetical protein